MTTSKEPAINSTDWCTRNKFERIYPEGEWNDDVMFGKYTSSQHPFIQNLIDIGAHVTVLQGEIVIAAYSSLVMLHIYKDFINLECIATPVEFRGEGSATKTMEALVAVSDETGIPIRLRACNVTGHGWNMVPNHIVIMKAMQKKNKIPVAQLPKWYQKFGFVTVAQVFYKGKAHGWNMQYIPKQKTES